MDGFDGTVNASVMLSDTSPAPIPLACYNGVLPTSVLHARLTSPLSSADAVKGASVDAVVTQPLFSANGTELLVEEGTRLQGTVVQV